VERDSGARRSPNSSAGRTATAGLPGHKGGTSQFQSESVISPLLGTGHFGGGEDALESRSEEALAALLELGLELLLLAAVILSSASASASASASRGGTAGGA